MKREVKETFVTLITAAFGLVAALAWNAAIQQAFKEFLGTSASTLAAMFSYAIIVTILAVFVTLWVAKLKPKK